MRPEDTDWVKLGELIFTCRTWHDVDELVKAYNETAFTELVHTLRHDGPEGSDDGACG